MENMSLLNDDDKKLWSQEDRYLLFVKDLKQDTANEEEQFAGLKEALVEHIDNVNFNIDGMEYRIEDRLKKLEDSQKAI